MLTIKIFFESYAVLFFKSYNSIFLTAKHFSLENLVVEMHIDDVFFPVHIFHFYVEVEMERE